MCKVTIAQEEKHNGLQLCGTTLGLLGNHWIAGYLGNPTWGAS